MISFENNNMEMQIQLQRQERIIGPLTEQINNMITLHSNGELTQSYIHKWLNTLPEDQKNDAMNQLEVGLSDRIENLPE